MTGAAGSYQLTITDGGNTVYRECILAGGMRTVNFGDALVASGGNALVASMSAGGNAVASYLNLLGYNPRP